MANVIDSLIVTLGLDSSSFKTSAATTQATIGQVSRTAVASGKGLEDTLKKTQDATDRRLKQTADVGRTSSQQFHRFRGEVAALFTTLATGFGLQAFVKGIANTEAATGRLATNIGMSTGELNAWQEAAKRNGGTAEATGASFLGLANQFQQMSLGLGSAVIPYFRTLGVALSDTHGEMRPMRDIMLDLADKFSKMTPQRANAFGAAIGLDQGTITLLRNGRQAVLAYLDEAKKIGVISDQDAAAGIKFEQSLARFEQSIRNLGRAIGNDLMPIFEEWMDDVTQWLADPANQQFIQQTVHDDIKKFADGVKNVIAIIKEWHGVAEAIALYIGGRWLLAMTVGLGPVGIAVAAIAAGFLAIQKGMQNSTPDGWTSDSPLWEGLPREEQLKYPQSPESRRAAGKEGENPNPFHWWNPGSWANRPAGGSASTDMNPVQRGFLDTLAGPESGGRYDIKNGGSTFSGFQQFPSGVGPGGSSSASGRYQFTEGTWKELQRKYPGTLTDFSPKSQDAAAWLLASDRYRAATGGGDLEDDLRAGKTAQIAKALGPTWPSLPGGSQSHQTQATFDAAIKRNTAGQFTPSKGAQDNIITPAETFWNKNFGGPQPDPALSRFNMSSSQRDVAASNRVAAANSTTETNINGPITIHTQASDADGIARSLDSSLKKYSYVAQSNTGLV